MAGRSGYWVTLCAVCIVHVETISAGFFGEASKPWSTAYQWFGLKTTGTVFSGLASKPVVTVYSGLASKLVPSGFPVYASKSALAVW
jgi:hypothetical protein